MNEATLKTTCGLELDIPVIIDVAWLDERPQCRHLVASWRAGRDTGSRCENYGLRPLSLGQRTKGLGQPSPGYCPMNGGFCAMEDPGWTFKPGWDRWAQWHAEGHGHVTMKVWPGFRPGVLGCYVVAGDCMAPTWSDGDLVVARMGDADFTDGAACVISRRVDGIPVRGRYLKRLERIGEGLYYITADNPTFEPVLVPAETVNIVAVVQDVEPEAALDQLSACHVFDGDGRIIPNVQAVGWVRAGLEVYYPTDIRNALLAAEQAANETAKATGNQDDPFSAGFLTGYRAALTTVALAFGRAGLPTLSSDSVMCLSYSREAGDDMRHLRRGQRGVTAAANATPPRSVRRCGDES